MSEPGLGWPVNDRQAAPSGGGGWTPGPYRPATTRAKAAMVVIAIAGLVDAAQLAWGISGLDLLARGAQGLVTEEEGAAYDNIDSLLSRIALALLIAGAVTVIAWLARSVDNVPKLTDSRTDRSPNAAIGFWFVPLANWVVPYQIVNDVAGRMRTASTRDIRGFVLPWWLCWVAGNVIAAVETQLLVRADAIEDYRAAVTVSIVEHGLSVIAAILLVLVIRGVDAGARALAVERAAAAAAPVFEPVAEPQTRETTVADAAGPSAPPPPPPAG